MKKKLKWDSEDRKNFQDAAMEIIVLENIDCNSMLNTITGRIYDELVTDAHTREKNN